MATITISDLSPTGLNLFSDPENYLDELSDNNLTEISGGGTPSIAVIATLVAVGTFAVSYTIARNKK